MARRTNRVAWGLLVGLAVGAGSAALLANPDYWGHIDGPLGRVIFINELAMSAAIIWVLARSRDKEGRTPAIVLATALLGATLLDTPLPGAEPGVFAGPLVFCFALGLVVVFAVTRRWNLFWLGMAALWGGLILVVRLVGLARSFLS